MTDTLRVVLEIGKKRRVVAGALEWPGLDRWGPSEVYALDKLTSYLPRYAGVAERAGSMAEPDYAAIDRLLPHPVYAKQLWISILNPSDATFRDVVLPLLVEAHDRLAAQRARHGRATA